MPLFFKQSVILEQIVETSVLMMSLLVRGRLWLSGIVFNSVTFHSDELEGF